MAVTSANIVSDTAGVATEGARARAVRLLQERVAAARTDDSMVASSDNTENSA